MKKFEVEEEFFVENFEVNNFSIERTDYRFTRYRKYNRYENDSCWMEVCDEYNFDLHALRLA